MNYKVVNNQIRVYSIEEFNPTHIFECGQVFSYNKIDDESYVFYPGDKVFLVYKENEYYVISQIGGKTDLKKIIELFDLDVDYGEIKTNIKKLIKEKDFNLDREIIKESLSFGYGIRILKQESFETIISFVFSQNNNIKRIKNSLDKLREKLGKKIKIDYSNIDKKEIIEFLKKEKFYSFPNIEDLEKYDEKFFISLGAGYRAKYLVELIRELNKIDLQRIKDTDTAQLRNDLINLKGIGRKVANCILLFGFSRTDVFPVDTWICQIYKDLIKVKGDISAIKISDVLEKNFKNLSGYIQQYLFYYKRSFLS